MRVVYNYCLRHSKNLEKNIIRQIDAPIIIHNVRKLMIQGRVISTTFLLRSKNEPEIKIKDRVWTIPNALCLSRIVASPVLSYCIINQDFNSSICILTADGWIARKFHNQSSKLGSFLDPLADKILVISLYGSLAYAHIIPDILVGLIIVRDIALLSAGIYIRYLSIPPPKTFKKYFNHKYSSAQLSPTLLSKFNTVVQLGTAIASLCGTSSTLIPEVYLVGLWYFAGFTTITSGISYIFTKNTFTIFNKKK